MDIEASHNFRKVNEKLTASGVVHPDALITLGSNAYIANVLANAAGREDGMADG